MKQAAGFQPHNTCRDCETKFNTLVIDDTISGGTVGYHLFQHLKKENEHAKTNKGLVVIKAEQRRIWNALSSSRQKGTSEKVHDGYVVQTLDVNGARETAWDGTKWNPLLPSIEVIDPAVLLNEKTAYHVFNNIMIVSDSINRAKKHYPPLIIHGVLLFREANRLKD